MRVSKGRAETWYDGGEQKTREPSLKDQQTFHSLFQFSVPSQPVIEEDEDAQPHHRKQLDACLVALLQNERVDYQDQEKQVRSMDNGRLYWRLLSGALQGCTLYVRWRHRKMTVDFSAPDPLATRLLTLQEEIQRRVNAGCPSFIIEIKVTRESGYA